MAWRTNQDLERLLDLDPEWLVTLAEVVRVSDEQQRRG